MNRVKQFIITYKEILCISLIFTAIYTYLSIARHNNFQSHAYDLGLYDQVMWLYSRFEIPYSSFREYIIWGDHFHPILILFVPLYFIWADPRILLMLQALLVCFSAVPIYLIAEKLEIKKLVSLTLATSYLLFSGLQSALEFDFHVATLSVFFLAWMLYFYHINKNKSFWIFVILTLLCKEDMALVIFMLGVYDIFVKKNFYRGMKLSILSLGTLFVYLKIISPHFNSKTGEYLLVLFPGETFVEQVQYVFRHPIESLRLVFGSEIKILTYMSMLVPFLFLPLLSLFSLLLGLPLFAERFFSLYEFRWGTEFHYGANSAPVLMVGFLYVLSNMYQKFGSIIYISKNRFFTFFALLFIGSTLFLTFSEKTFLTWFWTRDLYSNSELRKQLEQNVFAGIPQKASLSAMSAFVPHVSQRAQVNFFPYGQAEATYILASRDVETYPYLPEEMILQIANLLEDSNYEVVTTFQNTYLFRKKVQDTVE